MTVAHGSVLAGIKRVGGMQVTPCDLIKHGSCLSVTDMI